MVTGDALYAQRELSRSILEAGRGLLMGAEGQPARGEGDGELAL